jgi:nucleoside-diphosphate-sugar epimerase
LTEDLDLSGKHILITGGAGYLATNLVALLGDTDCRITRLDREGAKFPPVKARQIVDATADIRDAGVWKQFLGTADVLFHFAAQTSVYVANKDPMADLAINFLPMLHLLETCRQQARRLVVLFSGTATECGMPRQLPVDETHPDHPITAYDLHKLMSENYLKYYIGQDLVRGVILRLANVYGPGPRSSNADRGVLNLMVRKAINGEDLPVYGAGEVVRDYVYVRDVAAAFLLAARKIDQVNGRHFVISSGLGHTLLDAITLVADRVELKTGRRSAVKHVDPPADFSAIENRNFVGDSTSFNQATGWQAQVSLADGIDRTIAAFLDAQLN